MDNIFVSVVMPLYNKIDYVEQAINSVLNQTYQNFELLVIDDESTDGSYELVKDYFAGRLNLIRKKNGGPGSARNLGIRSASPQCRLVAFIDADDIWASFHLEMLVKAYLECPGAGIISGQGEKIETKNCMAFKPKRSEGWRKVDYIVGLARGKVVVHTSSLMVPKNILDSVGGFENFRPGQDIDLWVRIALRYPIIKLNSITSCHRLGTGGIMDQSDMYLLRDTSYKPKALAEVSPLLGRLEILMRACDERSPERNKLAFLINSRVMSHIKILVANDARAKAKALSSLFVKPKAAKFLVVYFLFFLPDKFISLALTAFIYLKRKFG